MPNITIFNTYNENLRLYVNQGGAALAIPGTGQNWQPNFVSASFNQSAPSPDTFGTGQNQIMVSTGYSSEIMTINIPGMRVNSLQLYIFMSNTVPNWVLLADGQLVGGRIPSMVSSVN